MTDRPRGGQGRRSPPLRVVPDLGASDQQRVHLGDRLRAVRQQKGLTQEKAAASAGITRNRLAQLEKSRFPNPRLSTLLRLMTTYELRTVEELLGPTPSAVLAAAWEDEGWASSPEQSSR
jgi:transcriptional regulator with XRE-family HTH domain